MATPMFADCIFTVILVILCIHSRVFQVLVHFTLGIYILAAIMECGNPADNFTNRCVHLIILDAIHFFWKASNLCYNQPNE